MNKLTLKIITFISMCFLHIYNPIFGQNPSFSNILSIENNNQQFQINYDINSSSAVEISLYYSENLGNSFKLASNVTGDIGAGISSGLNKEITWNYSDDVSDLSQLVLKLIATDPSQTFDVCSISNQVDTARIKDIFTTWTESRHHNQSADKNAVAERIENILQSEGLKIENQNFTFNQLAGTNIIGRKQGLKHDSLSIIIDAHFDAVAQTPGADDNLSGVIGVLEAARILKDYHFEKNLLFIAFDLEESGLLGANNYVQNGIKSFEKIEAVLNFEMIGFYSEDSNSQMLPAGFNQLFPQQTQAIQNNQNRGDFLTNVANQNSVALMNALETSANTCVPDLKVISLDVPGNGQIAPDLRRSDHAPFWDAGIQALMLTDGANFRNPYYHTVDDTFDKLDLTFMRRVIEATIATAVNLASPMAAGYAEFSPILLSNHSHSLKNDCEWKLFPNPSSGILSIENSNCKSSLIQVEIFNQEGKRLIAERMNFENRSVINLEQFENGFYLVKINYQGGSYSEIIVLAK